MKAFLKVLLMLLLAKVGFAQQFPIGSIYYANMLSINPAFVGYNSKSEIYLGHRNQFVGFQNSPKTNYLTFSGRFSSKHRVGLTAFSDKTVLFTKNIVNGNYGYSLQFGSGSQLVFALGAGLSSLDLDFNQSIAVDLNDQVYTTLRQSKMGFNADFGVLLDVRKVQFGFSIPQLFNNATTFELENNKLYTYKNYSHFRGTAKYDIGLGSKGLVNLSPMVMIRSVKGAPLQFDLNAILDHANWGWVGVTYHSDFAFATSIGVRFQNFTVGYAHDFIVGDLQRFGRFASELLIGYTFDKRKSTNENLATVLDPRAKEAAKSNNAPTEKELEQMRLELEKKRKQKLNEADSLDKVNEFRQQEEEKRLISESQKIAKAREQEQESKAAELKKETSESNETQTRIEQTADIKSNSSQENRPDSTANSSEIANQNSKVTKKETSEEAQKESKVKIANQEEVAQQENQEVKPANDKKEKVNDIIAEAEKKMQEAEEELKSEGKAEELTITNDPSQKQKEAVSNEPTLKNTSVTPTNETTQSNSTKQEEKPQPREEQIVKTKVKSETENSIETVNVETLTANTTDVSQNSSEKTVLVFAEAIDYRLENDSIPDQGFYIILGAFANHSNTVKFLKTLSAGGIDDAFIVKNQKKNLEEVCVYFSREIALAKTELMKFKATGRKSRILNLK